MHGHHMMVSIRIKLGVLAGVLVSVVLAVAGGFYSFFALQRGDALVVSLAGTARVLSEQIERDAIAVLAGIEDESARASLRKSAETFDATLDRMVKGDDSLHVLAATDQVLVEQLKAVGGAWQRTKQGALLIAGSQTGTDAMRRAYADFADANAVLERQIDAAVTLFQQQASGKVATLQRMTAAAVALAFIVAFLGWLATGTLVVGPVRRLVASAMRLADGDLDQAPEFTNLDEVGEAGRSLRHVIDVLNSVIASIQQLSRGMETTSTLVRGGSRAVVHNVDRQTQLVDGMLDVFRREMDATFARVEADIGSLSEAANSGASASHELERAMQELADGGEVLSASVGQTASAQTELGASMREVSESVEVLLRQMDVADGALNGIAGAVAEVRGTAEETSRLAETVIVDARNGLSAVQSTQLGNEGIRRVTGEGKASIESLHDRLQAMEQIMDVINSVAYETNILALNAAIIASQAGEQGRSFAVVAERVRGLAERSARSTHDVSALITGIRGDSQRAVDAMTRAEQEVDKGVELSVHAVDALGKIVDSAQRSTQRVQDIATTASEQTRGSMAALEAMASARTMCSRIAAAMQEQTRGSSVIANAASRIDAIARQVRDATRGQVTAMTHIRKLGEEVGGIVGSVEKAIEVHRRAREGFLETAGQLVEIARDTGAQARKTDQVIIDMAQHASLLGDQVSRFRLRRLEPRQKARNQST